MMKMMKNSNKVWKANTKKYVDNGYENALRSSPED